jgi:hypothetical protein
MRSLTDPNIIVNVGQRDSVAHLRTLGVLGYSRREPHIGQMPDASQCLAGAWEALGVLSTY